MGLGRDNDDKYAVLVVRNFLTIRSLAVVFVMVAPNSPTPPSAHILTSPVCRLKPRRRLPPVTVLPALHQHHQGVEPEEDDDGDDDALEDDPDVDVVVGVRACHLAVVSQLFDRSGWVLEAKGERSPDNKVQQNQKGHNLKN